MGLLDLPTSANVSRAFREKISHLSVKFADGRYVDCKQHVHAYVKFRFRQPIRSFYFRYFFAKTPQINGDYVIVFFAGNNLLVCKADSSCCTSEMESNLMTSVKKDYHSMLQHNAQSVQGILASTAIHFQGKKKPQFFGII